MTFLFKAKYLEIQSDRPANDARFRQFKKDFPEKILSIDLERHPVSANLRGWYRGGILPTVKATVPEWRNLSEDDVHEILKKIHNGFNFFNPLTKRTERIGRSAMGEESSTTRAIEFIEKIRLWLAEEYYVEIPNPKEYKKLLDNPHLL